MNAYIRIANGPAVLSDGCAVVIQPSADEVQVARRWSARSAELAPQGGLNWVPFGQVKEQW
jgi:acyl-CoA reductase-like NAD-dependent aldehyde dehydrogenase